MLLLLFLFVQCCWETTTVKRRLCFCTCLSKLAIFIYTSLINKLWPYEIYTKEFSSAFEYRKKCVVLELGGAGSKLSNFCFLRGAAGLASERNETDLHARLCCISMYLCLSKSLNFSLTLSLLFFLLKTIIQTVNIRKRRLFLTWFSNEKNIKIKREKKKCWNQ